MLSVICCRPGPWCIEGLPCSSGPVAAGLRGSCWRQLHSGRLRWSAWQQLQPAWLQPAEDSDTDQFKIALAKSYAIPGALTMSSRPPMISTFLLFTACPGSALPDEVVKAGRREKLTSSAFLKDWLDLLQVLHWCKSYTGVCEFMSTTALAHPDIISQQASPTSGPSMFPP